MVSDFKMKRLKTYKLFESKEEINDDNDLAF